MNITEKIIARASNKNTVSPGDVVFANVDKLMIHDVSGPGVIKVFEEWSKRGIQLEKVWNADKIWVSEDHFVPSADRISAENITKLTVGQKNLGLKSTLIGLGQYELSYLSMRGLFDLASLCWGDSPLILGCSWSMAVGWPYDIALHCMPEDCLNYPEKCSFNLEKNRLTYGKSILK